VQVPRKFKSITALLGFLIAISGAISAQNRTTKRRIDFNASNEKREHNKERLIMIVTLEGILSLLLPSAVVAGVKHMTDKLASLLRPTSKITQRGPSFMKKLAVAWLVAMVLTLVGCGSNGSKGNINGTWTAVLSDTTFNFGTSVVVNNDGTLSASQFSFSTNEPCFVSGETESGSFAFTGDFSGNVTGHFDYKVVSGSPTGNALTLTGTANGNTISGNWSLTGGNPTRCQGSGTFTMTKS
jgi:hypothetical protein